MTNAATPRPDDRLSGYDPKQRAEILEAESVNVEDGTIVTEVTPDRGTRLTDDGSPPPEEQLHDAAVPADPAAPPPDTPVDRTAPLDRARAPEREPERQPERRPERTERSGQG